MKCKGPECDREGRFRIEGAAKLCPAHHMQWRRNGELRPLQSGDNTAQVTFRCTEDLKRRAEEAADGDVSEWWRQAGMEKLK